MNNDDTITIDLSGTEPVEFSWNESDMSVGIMVEEMAPAFTTMVSNQASNTVTLASGISITNTGFAASNPGYTISTPYDDLSERLSRLEKIIAEEEEVRRTHPAVKMAYDEYRLLYILAKKNPGDNLTE